MTKDTLFLLHSFLYGAVIAFLYDKYTIVRRVVPHPLFLEYLEDLSYFMFLGVLTILFLYAENHGVIRWFAVAGALSGIAVYRKTLGPIVVRVGVFVLSVTQKAVLFPLRKAKVLFQRIKFRKIRKEACKNDKK